MTPSATQASQGGLLLFIVASFAIPQHCGNDGLANQVVGEDKIDQFSKTCQKSAKMAPFAAVAPGGEVQRAIAGARVDKTSALGTTPTQVPGKCLVDALGRPTHAPFGRHFRRHSAAAAAIFFDQVTKTAKNPSVHADVTNRMKMR